jgi:Respiratory-chain NADH dehydrogenase 51 Kd subunit
MIIAAHAVGAAHDIVYLCAEYVYLREYLEQQLAELREEGLLGNGFDIRIQSGAGSYVCGDESALIESCEGKRGTPRLKPPFPVEYGFLGKPMAVNNVETFAAAARIMDRGADWFAAMGTTESKGTRLLSPFLRSWRPRSSVSDTFPRSTFLLSAVTSGRYRRGSPGRPNATSAIHWSSVSAKTDRACAGRLSVEQRVDVGVKETGHFLLLAAHPPIVVQRRRGPLGVRIVAAEHEHVAGHLGQLLGILVREG